MKKEPGKTLVVGASYVALECAGYLAWVMVRSILLRGFDQDIAHKIRDYMEVQSGIEFIRKTVPLSISKLERDQLLVKWISEDGEACEEIFDTVLNATGRDPDVSKLCLDKAGVKLNEMTGRIWVRNEQTSTPNVYAIGDVIDVPELTPVAIQAGRLLSRRLYNGSSVQMNYDNMAQQCSRRSSTGAAVYLKMKARKGIVKKMWRSTTKILFHWNGRLLRLENQQNSRQLRVGFPLPGCPNAGEVTLAIGLAMKVGFTHDQLIDTVGIHPTTAVAFKTLEMTKSSGGSTTGGGC
ncbi:hypothetical protein PsorP6_001869 [Peronosclerospora sorghi]|uniref:Uncharacterized protein n=1 Tax=Peronosclerospora sorghi TaxID=230839 RepID=A0ACC0WQ93_9STRA|nr:hypothetical protein PsorP6_001869 [Peronosclerospora sorghi]